MDNVIPFLIQHGYTVLFLWVLAETLGLPIPCVPLLITIGALAGIGQMSLVLGVGTGFFAAFLGDLFWYFMGRQLGGKVLSQICRISLEPDSCVRRTENIFARFGARSLLVTKFFPGLSAVSTPLAGTTGMGVPRFLIFDSAGILLWIGAYVLFGYVFSRELDRGLAYALGMGRTLLVLVAVALAVYILRKYLMRRRFLRQLTVARITPEELKRKLDNGERITVIDVRHALDFEADPAVIPGALRIPFEQIEDQPPDVPAKREIVVYCT
jgi:membrane protein DedA with SNARE-associated domain